MTDADIIKQHASELLHRYEAMHKEMRTLERDLSKAVTAYGRATGCWGLTRYHMRIELDNAKESNNA